MRVANAVHRVAPFTEEHQVWKQRVGEGRTVYRKPPLERLPLSFRGIKGEIASAVLRAQFSILINRESEVRPVDLFFDDYLAFQEFTKFRR